MSAIRDFFSSVWVLLSSMKVQDIIDILLVTVLMYYVLTFIRDRRAGRVVIGVVILLVVRIVANLFGLLSTGYILGNFFEIGFLALIVLFQPELRSALEKVGSEPWNALTMLGDRNPEQSKAAMIESICDASVQMSKEKTGALMVIERSTKLGEYINTGTVINADPSAPMIENLFFKNSPLHDGAVIFRSNRVYAAGCFLPLSGNPDFRDLGTRHHAAVGITEVSDSIVVVVSEQSGTISVALDGKLRRNLDYVALKRFLSMILLESEGAEKNGRKKGKRRKQSGASEGEEV